MRRIVFRYFFLSAVAPGDVHACNFAWGSGDVGVCNKYRVDVLFKRNKVALGSDLSSTSFCNSAFFESFWQLHWYRLVREKICFA